MTTEDDIFPELWNFIQTTKNKRINILEEILPERLKPILNTRNREIKAQISKILSDKMNQIVQNNIWFLIQNNIGNFNVMEDLFCSVVDKLKPKKDVQQLQKIIKSLLSEINVEKNYEMVCYNPKLAWGVYAIVELWIQSFDGSFNSNMSRFLNLLLTFHKFFVAVLKEGYIIKSIRSYRSFRTSAKNLGASSSKKGGLFQALTGFLKNESASEEDELKLMHTSSNSLRVRAMFQGRENLVDRVLLKIKENLDERQSSDILTLLKYKIMVSRLNPRKMQLIIFMLNLFTDVCLNKTSLFVNNWEEITDYLMNPKLGDQLSTFNFDALSSQSGSSQNDEEPAPGAGNNSNQEDSSSVVSEEDDAFVDKILSPRVKISTKKRHKLIKNILAHSKFNLIMLMIRQSPELDSFTTEKQAKYKERVLQALQIFDEFSVDILPTIFEWIRSSLEGLLLKNKNIQLKNEKDKACEYRPVAMEFVRSLLNRLQKLLESKAVDGEAYDQICHAFLDLVEQYFELVSLVQTEDLLRLYKVS